ncbi:fimbrial protein [Acinetobacter bereziniae]|uniref:fimbrial protein n=1 Tax=Acinetobacter bereziniae TaxID=106648 RepID=UPI001D18E482|nr:fimbrial protein [Acinetobacter bereziniae]
MSNCTDQVAVRSDFKITPGNTNLTAGGSGSFPFGVDANIIITNSSADIITQNLAKIWLSQNLKISFDLRDDSRYTAVEITELNKIFNVHPNTSQPGRVTINGEEYLRASSGLRNAGFHVPNTGIALTNTIKPSSNIINALNGAIVRIHLGTLTYKYDNYNTQPPTGIPNIASIELYLNLKLTFSLPTCTMLNQVVNLAPVPTATLNSNQTANEQPFNVNINCTAAMPNKVLLATITDSYTPSNVNTNGILKNSPSLANRSNVDVQLRDDTNTPLAIGTQSPFYSIPVGSTATTFIKALKARYYRTLATATPGYVQTQATVSLDYQ